MEDAHQIRSAIVNCFERANIPGLLDEERENQLTFAVIGASPTGIEFAAELRDFIEEALSKRMAPNTIRIYLNTFVSRSLRPLPQMCPSISWKQNPRDCFLQVLPLGPTLHTVWCGKNGSSKCLSSMTRQLPQLPRYDATCTRSLLVLCTTVFPHADCNMYSYSHLSWVLIVFDFRLAYLPSS